uniref:Uncharacterized protein n=1 Tax=Rhizophora mucronata TaxID=61149 RepID=A0A2P2L2P0_RHIMU
MTGIRRNKVSVMKPYISSTFGWNILFKNPMEGDLYG